jgi:hypothetical protein
MSPWTHLAGMIQDVAPGTPQFRDRVGIGRFLSMW